MTVKFTNNASTTVGTGINASATSLTVASASSFPSLSGADDYCYLTLQAATSSTREVVKATALSGNTFTIVRAQDNTSAATFAAGDIVELRMTAALLTDVIDAATVEGVKTNFQYTPTAGQTVFSGADNASNTMIINQAALVSVYMNGVRLVQGTDYNVSSANNTVTLTVGATTADIIDIEVFGNFTGQSGAAVAITGGAISGASVAATTLSASGTATLNTFVSNNITVSGGSINNVNIGATTAGTGRFSTLAATGNSTFSGTVTGGNGTFSNLTINAAEKLRLDGAGGHTFIQESSNDTIVFATGGSTRLTLNANATFSGNVTATTLIASNGVLELDDNGSHNGIINSPASLFINIDSDNGATGEDFVIGKDRTATSGGTELFRVQEDGKVGINTTIAPLRTLDVKGSVNFSVNTSTHETFIFTTGAVNDAKLLMKNASSATTVQLQANGDSYFNGGSVGIGTDNPGGLPLHLKVASGDNKLRMQTANKDAFVMELENSTGNLKLGTNTTAGALVIADGGNVGIGTTNPQRRLHVSMAGADIVGNSLDAAIFQNSDAVGIRLVDQGNAGSNGGNAGLGNDNGNLNVASAGVMTFSTNLAANAALFGGASTGGTERMRITTTGLMGVGTDNPQEEIHAHHASASCAIRASGQGNHNRKIEIGYDSADGPVIRAGSSGQTGIKLYYDNTSLGALLHTNGDWYTNDGTVHSLSDARIKTDVNDLVDGLDIVKQLKPKTFKYSEASEFYNEETKDEVRYGFVANEVEEIAPQYTNISKGKISGEEVDDLKTLSATKMIPMLVKAIQEQQALIESLTARVAELENN